MPDNSGTGRVAVEAEVAEIERLCGELEASLVRGDWNAAGNALRDSRRCVHAFVNAMEACSERDEDFDKAVYARMRFVFDARESQLTRLRAFHSAVGERLKTLSGWKRLAGALGSKRAPARTAGFDSLG